MFNPLVDNLSNLTDNELENKISELGRKYFQARNPQVQIQISSILDMYKEERKSRQARRSLSEKNDDNGLDNLINIS